MKSIRRERIAIIHAYGTPSVSEGGFEEKDEG